MHTCKISNKSYIGYTSSSIKRRFQGHLGEMRNGSKYAFHNALRLHGKENFISEILYICFSEESALLAEVELIQTYDTYKNGYNMTAGGESPPKHAGKSHYRSKEIIIDSIRYCSLTDARIKLKTNQKILNKYINEYNGKISFNEFNNQRRKISPITVNGKQYQYMKDVCDDLNINIDTLRAFIKSKSKDIHLFLSTYDTRRKIIELNGTVYNSKNLQENN